MKRAPRTSKSVGLIKGFRSGLEDAVAAQIRNYGLDPAYETTKIEYAVPARKAKYTPDFPLGHIVIETKGRFDVEDRKKHLLIKQQYPELDLRFVFSNSRQRIRKGSPTTYADWCNKHGFLFADKLIPEEWLREVSRPQKH